MCNEEPVLKLPKIEGNTGHFFVGALVDYARIYWISSTGFFGKMNSYTIGSGRFTEISCEFRGYTWGIAAFGYRSDAKKVEPLFQANDDSVDSMFFTMLLTPETTFADYCDNLPIWAINWFWEAIAPRVPGQSDVDAIVAKTKSLMNDPLIVRPSTNRKEAVANSRKTHDRNSV